MRIAQFFINNFWGLINIFLNINRLPWYFWSFTSILLEICFNNDDHYDNDDHDDDVDMDADMDDDDDDDDDVDMDDDMDDKDTKNDVICIWVQGT